MSKRVTTLLARYSLTHSEWAAIESIGVFAWARSKNVNAAAVSLTVLRKDGEDEGVLVAVYGRERTTLVSE